MSNKNIFKELYSQKINKNNNYQKVLERIEKHYKKKELLKKIIIPVSSLAITSFLILINVDDKNNDIKITTENINQYNENEIYINTSSNTNSYSSDIDVLTIDTSYEEIINQVNYTFIKDINIHNNLDNKTYYKKYIKDNENSNYNILYNYEILYQNTNKDRKITLSFSDKYKPLRDYILSNDEKISIINNTEVILYQNNNSYIVTFTYNNIHFDIETKNINKEELLILLSSIIK